MGIAEIAARTEIRFLLDNSYRPGRVLDIKANNYPIGQISDFIQHGLPRIDLVRLIRFEKTNRVPGERGGVKTYTMYYRAELQVIETFLTYFGRLVAVPEGAIGRLEGDITFRLTENGWEMIRASMHARPA